MKIRIYAVATFQLLARKTQRMTYCSHSFDVWNIWIIIGRIGIQSVCAAWSNQFDWRCFGNACSWASETMSAQTRETNWKCCSSCWKLVSFWKSWKIYSNDGHFLSTLSHMLTTPFFRKKKKFRHTHVYLITLIELHGRPTNLSYESVR